MRTVTIVLLVIVVAVVSFYYGRHGKTAPVHADMEAYDRCVTQNDEAHWNEVRAGRGGKEDDARWLRARAYCRVNLWASLKQVEEDLKRVGLGAQR